MRRLTNRRKAQMYGNAVVHMLRVKMWYLPPYMTTLSPIPEDRIAARAREAASFGRRALRYERRKLTRDPPPTHGKTDLVIEAAKRRCEPVWIRGV